MLKISTFSTNSIIGKSVYSGLQTGKVSAKIFSQKNGHTSIPTFIPDRECGNFLTLVANFLLPNKKVFFPKSHELEHYAEVEKFPLQVEIFPFAEFFFVGIWTISFAKFHPK